MNTITVDDGSLVVTAIVNILKNIDKTGNHFKAYSAENALEIIESEKIDVAFLDIELQGANGLELAKKIQEKNQFINIIFITGHKEYSYEAHEIYATAFLLKPITKEKIEEALKHLRYQIPKENTNQLDINCFGIFNVLYKGVPLKFERSKTKELLAVLVDKRGAMCDSDTLIAYLWQEKPNSASVKSQLRVLISDLMHTLTKLGLEDCIFRSRDSIGINKEMVNCDYYSFLEGDPFAIHSFREEYMTQYTTWSRETELKLQRNAEEMEEDDED